MSGLFAFLLVIVLLPALIIMLSWMIYPIMIGCGVLHYVIVSHKKEILRFIVGIGISTCIAVSVYLLAVSM